MSWYKTGTITVTNASAAVTGAGTAWVANAAAGEAIYLPDGKFYEIASVNADASLTLSSTYTGTSLAGQSYTILPSQSFIRDLAAQAAALINGYAAIANAAGAGKFGDGTLGAPGISFVNDTNTGIRRTADGTFRLVANGVDIAEIGPSGATLLSPDGTKSLTLTNTGVMVTGSQHVTDHVMTPYFLAQNGGSAAMPVVRLNNESNTGLYGGASAAGISLAGVQALGVSASRISAGSAGRAFIQQSTTGDTEIGGPAGSNYTDIFVGGVVVSRFTGAGQALTGSHSVSPSNDATNSLTIYRGVSGGYELDKLIVSAAGADATYTINRNGAGTGRHVWKNESATHMVLDANGYLGLGGSPSSRLHAIQSGNADTLIVENTNASFTSAAIIAKTSKAAGADFSLYAGIANSVVSYLVLGNGNVQNLNNSYGSISDVKLKQDIKDAKSQWGDVTGLRVRKFRLKSDPTGPLMMGLIAQEAELVSPGLIETTDDYEEVVVEPARTEIKINQRQKTQKVIVEQPTPTLVEGRYVLRMVATEIEAPLFEEHPLYAEDGSPIMEIVEPEQLAVTDEGGTVITPAKPAVTRQAVHRVPVMEDVEETVEIPAKTERRPTGTQTKSVKYSILYMKAVKALQEAMERIETLEAEVAAIKRV